MNDDAKTLSHFFGAYFHQDWDIEGAKSWVDVVARFVADNPPKRTDEVHEALRRWVDASSDDEMVRGLLNELECDYDWQQDGLSARDWVLAIIRKLTN